MFKNTRKVRLAILTLFVLIGAGVWFVPYTTQEQQHTLLRVHFLDVGQGDAIFIESPSGIQVLVDGGPNSSILRKLSEQMSFFDRSIDMVIGTHPDADHISGLVDVLQRYNVDMLLVTNNKSDTATSHMYQYQMQQEGAQRIMARQGQVFDLGAGVFLKVLFPVFDTTNIESNASSIVVQVVYGNTSILLTGDSPKRIEEYLVKEGVDVQSDVLKVGHHGSRTSTSEMFLEAVNPTYAVISAGKDNRYGHPHVEVTDMLFNHHIKTVSTVDEGTITFLSDGTKIWRE